MEPGEVPDNFPEMPCNRSVARLRSLVEPEEVPDIFPEMTCKMSVAHSKDTMRLKTACNDFERLLPPINNLADESAVSVVQKIRPRERLDRAAPCQQQEDIELLSVGNRADYVCPHQPPGGPGEQHPGEDADGEDGQ